MVVWIPTHLELWYKSGKSSKIICLRRGDLFLADEQHNYLGRTCPWKRCEPGIRASCEAQHCGQRPFLYDDLHLIRLSKELIAQPPIELWPAVVSRVAVPADLEEIVIRRLGGR
jgi:hypothetical protein